VFGFVTWLSKRVRDRTLILIGMVSMTTATAWMTYALPAAPDCETQTSNTERDSPVVGLCDIQIYFFNDFPRSTQKLQMLKCQTNKRHIKVSQDRF